MLSDEDKKERGRGGLCIHPLSRYAELVIWIGSRRMDSHHVNLISFSYDHASPTLSIR